MWILMIICYFGMLTSLCLITITGLQCYFYFNIFEAGYQQFALFSTTFYMFSQTLVMFYFIGSGTAIKKEVQNSISLINNSYEKVKKTKRVLFPHLTFNMLIIGSSFILIGAVDTGAVSDIIQKIVFIVGYFHFLYTIKIQHNAFKENIDVIIEIAEMNNTNSITS